MGNTSYSEAPKAPDFVMPILELIAEYELHEMLWWRTDSKFAPITFWINTNDLLVWGCADAEEINKETLPVLRQAIADCKNLDEIGGETAGCSLFACRMKKMRPQGAAYPKERELWPLFDACGPEREIELGNPFKPGEYKPRSESGDV